MRSRPRPKSALLITTGVLCIVFGCLGLLCGGCNLFGVAFKGAGGPMGDPMGLYAHLKQEIPYWIEIDVVRSVVILLVSALFIVAGIGLISHKPWGRWLAAGSAVVMIAKQILYGFYYFVFFLPAMERWQRANFGAMPMRGIQQMSGGVGMVIVLALPVILLVLALLPATAAALRPPSRPADEEEDESADDRHDDEDDLDGRPQRPRPMLGDDTPSDRPDDQRFRARDE